jgi:hypothetical protein
MLSKLEDREIKRQYQLRESAPNSMNKRMRRGQQEEGSTVSPKNVTRTHLSKARSKGAEGFTLIGIGTGYYKSTKN